jgi:hypothetical protein
MLFHVIYKLAREFLVQWHSIISIALPYAHTAGKTSVICAGLMDAVTLS